MRIINLMVSSTHTIIVLFFPLHTIECGDIIKVVLPAEHFVSLQRRRPIRTIQVPTKKKNKYLIYIQIPAEQIKAYVRDDAWYV
jgi:hypothetical protein